MKALDTKNMYRMKILIKHTKITKAVMIICFYDRKSHRYRHIIHVSEQKAAVPQKVL